MIATMPADFGVLTRTIQGCNWNIWTFHAMHWADMFILGSLLLVPFGKFVSVDQPNSLFHGGDILCEIKYHLW